MTLKMHAKQPVVPGVPVDVWRSLYAAASDLRGTAPWEWMADCDVFGVRSKHSKETLYACILGAAGQTFGMAVYRGVEGLAMYLALENGEIAPDDDSLSMRQNSLLVEFTEKRFLEHFDLDVIQTLGLSCRGKCGWTLFRSLLPDHSPWPINESEARTLLDVLDVCKIHAEKLKADPDCDFSHGDDKIVVYVKSGMKWKPSWTPIAVLMGEPPGISLTAVAPLNEVLLQRVRNRDLSLGSVWEAAVFYLPSLVFDAERPYYPKVCALVEEKTGHCVAIEIVRPEQDPLTKLRNMALRRIDHFGYKPGSIRVDSPELLVAFGTLKEALSVEIEMDALKSMPELVQALYSIKHEERVL